MIIKTVPTAGGIALVTPKGYTFLTYENGYTISAPERCNLPRLARGLVSAQP